MSDFAAIVDHVRGIRHDLHRHPELGYEEHRTAGIVRAELDRLGIAWEACTETGTIARLAQDRAGEHVVLRADIDALPLQELVDRPHKSTVDGRMHACGHDGHCASLLGTAAWLAAHQDELQHPVSLFFQPAEEGKAGARAMIEAGALRGIDRIFGYHNWPPLPMGTVACVDGPLMAANGAFHITVTGKGGHASLPELCADPILAGAQIVQALQQIVSRQLRPHDPAVISVTQFQAGSAVNIIPETARLVGTLRAATTDLREDMQQRVARVAAQTAMAFNCTTSMDWVPYYPATVNDRASAGRARAALEQTPGVESFCTEGLPLMGSEDFSFYLERVPGCYVLIGAGRPDEPAEVCHSPRFDYNDDLLPLVIAWYARLLGITAPA